MAKPDPLIVQALRDAAESFNDSLQVLVLESYALSHNRRLDPETAERVARIARAARTAADLSRSLFGDAKEPGDERSRREP